MGIIEKLNWLLEERFQDLNGWQKGFIDDLYETMSNHPDEVSEDEVREFFTSRQIEKIEEIWEEIGP